MMAQEPTTAGRPLDVLLVEEAKEHAELIRRAFRSRGEAFRVRHVRNLSEARGALGESRPNVIVTEWLLRDGKGISLLSIDRIRLEAPLVVMDAFADAQCAVEAMRAGAMDFVDKTPETLGEMPEIVERALSEWRLQCQIRRVHGTLDCSEQGICAIIQSVPDVIYRLDHKGRIVFVNRAIEKYGYDPDDLIGREILDLVHEEDRPRARFRVNERRSGERRTSQFEVRLRTAERQSVSFEFQAQAFEIDPVVLVEAEGLYGTDAVSARNFQGTQGIARDITPRKRAEDARARTAGMLEEAAHAVLVADETGCIHYANPASEELTGRPAGATLGGTILAAESGAAAGRGADQAMWDTLRRGEPWQGCVLLPRGNGAPAEARVVATPLRNAAGDAARFLFICRPAAE